MARAKLDWPPLPKDFVDFLEKQGKLSLTLYELAELAQQWKRSKEVTS